MTAWRPRLGILLSGRGSNFEAIAANVLGGRLACDIGFVFDAASQRVTIVAAIDNLVKGAAGQAVQNMNLVLGYEETEALL